MRLFDLSHTVEAGMITYKGLPAPVICDFLTRERSREIYAAGVALVGIDSYNIDDTADGSCPAHPILLSGFETFPVRAYAVAED